MLKLTKAALALLALGLAPVAQAQTAAPANTPDMGTPAQAGAASDAPGTPYVKSTEGDWDIRCVHTKDGHDPCQLYQLLKDSTKNPVAEISMTELPPGQPAALGATIVTPLETLLPRGITLKIDSDPAKSYNFLFCNQRGCVANVGFTADELAAMKKGTEVKMTIVPVSAPDQTVDLSISLKGFTAALQKTKDINKANGVKMNAPEAPAPAPTNAMPKVPSLEKK